MPMKKYLLLFLGFLLPALGLRAELTIEDCLARAEANYPIIKNYELLTATTDIDLAEINKGWLPRIGLYGQGTFQNVVPAFPPALNGVLQQMGQEMRGLGKFQYKVGADLTQTVWDGGASKSRRDLSRSRSDVDRAVLDVELYAIRERVQNIFFAILLTEEQIAQSEVTRNLLSENLSKLRSMLRNGVAMQSDVDMIEAQMLTVGQNITAARSSADAYRRMLGLFIGEEVGSEPLARPSATMPSLLGSLRPELRLFEARLSATDAARRLTDTSLMPKIGLFAQAYYGYPGLNYFESMRTRDLSFNLLAGVKVSWNIDAFYTRSDTRRKAALEADRIEADRETFLFNTDLQSASLLENIDGLRSVMEEDTRIIELRSNVRRAAESQLANGVIDATALLTKISDENLARLNASLHEIQLLKEIYNLKYTLNR